MPDLWEVDVTGRPISSLVLAILLTRPLAAAQEQGQDEEREGYERAFYVSVLTGAGWPVGQLNVLQDPGFLGKGRVEYAFGDPKLRVGLELGYQAFDVEFPGTSDNEGILNLSLVVKALGTYGPYRPFALLGGGVYNSKSPGGGRGWSGGFQLGGGLELPISEHFSAITGSGFHLVFRGEDEDAGIWIEAYLGFHFRQP